MAHWRRRRGFELWEGGQCIIQLAFTFSNGKCTGWYWYGLGRDTRYRPCKTKEEAKAEATA